METGTKQSKSINHSKISDADSVDELKVHAYHAYHAYHANHPSDISIVSADIYIYIFIIQTVHGAHFHSHK